MGGGGLGGREVLEGLGEGDRRMSEWAWAEDGAALMVA